MSEQQQKFKVGCAALFLFGLIACFLAFVVIGVSGPGYETPSFWGDESSRYSRQQTYAGQSIPRFTNAESEKLSRALSEYEQQYGFCFGWRLTDGSLDGSSSSEVSSGVGSSTTDPESSYDRGSSRGPNTPVEVCDEWIELRVTVAYTSSFSDQWSGVELDVAKSSGLQLIMPSDTDFAELGIDAETFISAPVDATGHAVLALPLLLAADNEGFKVDQVKSRTDTPPQQSLPPADDGVQGVGRWIWMSLLGLTTVLAVVLGIRGVRREQAAQSGQDSPPPPGGNAAQPPGPGSGPMQPPQNQWHQHPGHQGPPPQGPPQQPPQQWGPPPHGPPQQPPQQWGPPPPQQPPDNPQWPPGSGPPGRGPQQ